MTFSVEPIPDINIKLQSAFRKAISGSISDPVVLKFNIIQNQTNIINITYFEFP